MDWTYDVVSIGYPGPVLGGRPVVEPYNLGRGWVGFDFAQAFGRPVKLVNDAAMQALGSYKGGKMLFLGLGTGLGTAMIVDGIVAPMEIGHLPYKKGTYEDYVGRAGLNCHGKKKWRRHVADVAERLVAALQPDDTVIGGGHAAKLKTPPPHCRKGDNANAFRGGFRYGLSLMSSLNLPRERARAERNSLRTSNLHALVQGNSMSINSSCLSALTRRSDRMHGAPGPTRDARTGPLLRRFTAFRARAPWDPTRPTIRPGRNGVCFGFGKSANAPVALRKRAFPTIFPFEFDQCQVRALSYLYPVLSFSPREHHEEHEHDWRNFNWSCHCNNLDWASKCVGSI